MLQQTELNSYSGDMLFHSPKYQVIQFSEIQLYRQSEWEWKCSDKWGSTVYNIYL